MAFGNFTLTGQFFGLDGATPATGRVTIDGNPQKVIDPTGKTYRVGPRTVVLDSQGKFSTSLPSNATTGNSTTIAFRVTVNLKHQNLDPVSFYARPIASTVDISAIDSVTIPELAILPAGPAGPQGPAGPAGPQGLPGPNSVANDTATASQINTPGTATDVALKAAYIRRWQPSTTYAQYDTVLSPTGDTVQAKAAVTTGAVYDASKWNIVDAADPFRYDPTRLVQWRAATAQVATRPARLVVVGDSITEGYGASVNSKRYLEILRDRLRQRWQPSSVVGGEGYVPSFYVSTTMTQRVNGTGGVYTQRTDLAGLGQRVGILGVGGSIRTFTFTGTGLDIYYTKGTPAGTFTWAIDGGGATAVNSNDPTLTGGRITSIRGLSAASHTLTLTATTGGNGMYLEGFEVYNGDEASGIHVIDGGHSGWQSDDYATGGTTAPDLWYDSLNAAAPDLVLVMLGINDWRSGSQARYAATSTKANLKTIVSKIRSKVTSAPSIGLVIPYSVADPGSTPDVWINYRQAIHDVAKEDGKLTLIDTDPAMVGGFVGLTDPYSLNYGTDYVHPNDKGHALLGTAIANALLSA